MRSKKPGDRYASSSPTIPATRRRDCRAADGVVTKAAPDGYTLLMEVVTANVMNSTLYPNLNYDFARDIVPVARLAEGPYVMVVNPSVPAETLREFVAYAKSNPGRINMASTGNGS